MTAPKPLALDRDAVEALTPTRFVDDILSACDASNWDADMNKGDYYRGLRDAYKTVHELTCEYQTAMYAWTKHALIGQPARSRNDEAVVGLMTMETIELAFDEWRKTLTVADRPSNQEIFSQGYVAGWNAKESTAPSTNAQEPARSDGGKNAGS